MVNRKLNGGKQPFTNLSSPAGAPVPKLDRQIKPQKTGILQRSLGVSGLTNARAPGAQLVHRLSTTTVDNLDGVWEFYLNEKICSLAYHPIV